MLSLYANYYRCLIALLLWGMVITPVWAQSDDIVPIGYQYYEQKGLSLVYPDTWSDIVDDLSPFVSDRSVSFMFSDSAFLVIHIYFKEKVIVENIPDIYSYLNTKERLDRDNNRYILMRKAISYPPYRGVMSRVNDDSFGFNFLNKSIVSDLSEARVFITFSDLKVFNEKYQDYDVERHFATITNSIKIEP